MNNFKYHFPSTAAVLLISLTLHSCQHRLQVTDENENTAKSGVFMPSSKRTIETTPPSRKRPAEALFQDTEEKKESPTALEQPMSSATSVIPVRDIAASITQTSQESAAMTLSPFHAVTALTKTEQQNIVMAKTEIKDASKKAADEEDQKESADLEHWFKEFAEAVDDEEVLSLGKPQKPSLGSFKKVKRKDT